MHVFLIRRLLAAVPVIVVVTVFVLRAFASGTR
jgi:hypothetical protein